MPVPSVVDLVFTDASPNYCNQNETLGIYGTIQDNVFTLNPHGNK